jgi:hypothetical protein
LPNNIGVTITPNVMGIMPVTFTIINLTVAVQSGTVQVHFW